MSDPIANAQLELACRLGAIDDILEALEDGADIDCNGNAPIFTAVMADDRPVVEILVEKGVDVSPFELPADLTDPVAMVEALMNLAPKTEEDIDAESVDPKQVRAFDRMIRKNGLGEPLLKKRGDEYPVVRDALMCIAAEECHACVEEFLKMMEATRSGGGGTEDEVENSTAIAEGETQFDVKKFLEENSERIAALSERYVAVEDLPGDLLKEYLKEMKKLTA